MKIRQHPYYLAFLVGIVTAVLYLPLLGNGFVIWDDDRYVLNNPHIRSLDLSFLRWAITDLSEYFWQPLGWMFHAVDYALWGLNPAGHHLTSLLLHAVNAFLVVILAFNLLKIVNSRSIVPGSAEVSPERSAVIAAGAAGLLFGIHPVQVETVAWVTAKHDLLFTFWFLLSAMSYLHYAAGQMLGAPLKSLLRSRVYLVSLVCFLLSLSSKPSAVVLPFVLLIIDWYPLRRIRSAKDTLLSLLEKGPFLAFALIVSMATVVAHHVYGALTSADSSPVLQRFLVAARALVLYLWKLLVPVHLVPLYPYPKDISLWSLRYLSAVVIICAMTAFCVAAARKRPWLPALWSYFLLTLISVLGLVQVRDVFMADRYLYLPAVGPFLMVGAAVSVAEARMRQRRNKRLSTAVLGMCSIVLCVLLSYGTVRQMAVWKNTVALWSYVIEKDGDDIPRAFNNRGAGYMEEKRLDAALADLNRALQLQPRPYLKSLAYKNRGVILMELGRNEEALTDLTAALELSPGYIDAYYRRGQIMAATGRFDEAIEDFTNAITLDPTLARAYIRRGIVHKAKGQYEQARTDYTSALSIDPTSAEAYNNRGVVFKHMERFDLAYEDYSRAIAINPSFSLAYCNRAIVLSRMGKIESAIGDYTRALSLEPGLIKAYFDRGELFRKTGRNDLAKQDFQRACDLGAREGCAAFSMLQGRAP